MNSHSRHHQRMRLCFAAATWVAVFLLTGCTAAPWHQIDPEYTRLLGEARTDCRGDEIVGIWVTKTSARAFLAPMRHTMLFRPDGTGRIRAQGVDFANTTWSYNGRGVWTIKFINLDPRMAFNPGSRRNDATFRMAAD